MLDRSRLFLLGAALVVGGAHTLAAQNARRATGSFSVRGTVRDTAATPIAGASVTIYGLGRATTTNTNGEFSFADLPGGTRVLEVLALGYKPRILAIAIADSAPLSIEMRAGAVALDSVHTTATIALGVNEPKQDRITSAELEAPDIADRTALEAFELLRPQLFRGRPSAGARSSEAAQRGQMFPRDETAMLKSGRAVCVGVRACDVDRELAVSINEGPLASPDVLTTLSVRVVKEMRYLLAVDAQARFGVITGNGPVLIVYTR